MQPDKLILFDIDGTMLHCGASARESLTEALVQVSGTPVQLHLEDVAGNTDLGIIRTALERNGTMRPENGKIIDQVINKYLDILQVKYPERGDQYLYRGVDQLLELLSNRKDIRLGILTGNLEPGARIKLEPFGIWDYFSFGAFGSDSEDRNELPKIAWKKAQSSLEETYSPAQTLIVGDTPRDAVCARVNNTHSLIISRRAHWLEAIRAENPDFIVDSTENVQQLYEYITGFNI